MRIYNQMNSHMPTSSHTFKSPRLHGSPETQPRSRRSAESPATSARLRAGGLVLCVMLMTANFLAAPRSVAQQNQQAPGAVFAISDGRGQISLMWFPQADRWPLGGWKIEDSTGSVVAARVVLGDSAALKSLSAADAAAIRNLPHTLSSPDVVGDRRKTLMGILALNAFGNPAYARALGVSRILQGVPPGPRTYKLSGLDGSGRPTGLVLSSAPVDSSVATPDPPAPTNPSAEASRDGVSLFWSPVPEDRQLPVIAYAVLRDSSGQQGVEVTPKFLILGTKWNPKNPAFADRSAPVEDTLTYHIMSVDIFGRRSAPADIRIFFPDFAALDPPEPVTAKRAPNGVAVSWKPAANPHTVGYVVERAYLFAGPFEVLTAQPLPPGTNEYHDADVRGGTAYYYRVRAVGPGGDLGPPSHAAMIQPRNATAPPKPANLKADLGTTRVRLTWTPTPFPVAGYFVERMGGNGIGAPTGATNSSASESGTNWARLNSHVTLEPLYDDFFGSASGTKLSYRIVAVAFDNAESVPSDPVTVVLPDTSLPGLPVITGADGSGGKAVLTFVPGMPEEKTAQFLVLRGGSPTDLGVVIGDPLPGSARRFEDAYVEPGNDYWYRLVALDQNGNRSDPTRPIAVRVGAPAVPTPAAPTLQFVTDPFPQVKIQFENPPAGLAVMVELREGETGRWLSLTGSIEGQSVAVDPNPPKKDPVFYRIIYRTANGATSSPSAPSQLRR